MDFIDVTLETDPVISVTPATIREEDSMQIEGPKMKPPSRLGMWFVKVLWM
jgi:hypothetical protein